MSEIGRFIYLEGLKTRSAQEKTDHGNRIVVSHDDVSTCGKGLVQKLIEQRKRKKIE